jgi:2-polyprenyl-3-methyl-5-hydroxy-6-metoxy-1,4-benzoquinol methylase
MTERAPPCRFCDGDHQRIASYDAPPDGETDFGITPYRRTLWQCRRCGHVINLHGFDLEASLYEGEYASATYGEKMRETFTKIMKLPPERSDNRQRIAVINAFAETMGWIEQRSCLDVGSGLGVFPAGMREVGWNCTALDPDRDATRMIGELAKVETLTGDFMTISTDERFDLLSFNKVLEHVRDPVTMLARSKAFLSERGAVYVELPDGEAALLDAGPEREEFFVEHFDAYSTASIALLIRASGFNTLSVDRVREPSGKYTLRAFAQPTIKGTW